MIDQIEPNFIRKRIGLITARALEECAWPCVDRKSVSSDGNLATLSGFSRIALAPAEPTRGQVCDCSQVPTEHPARTAPLDHEVTPGAKSNSATDWVVEIKRLWARGVSNTLELARIVFRARRTMRYGAWAQLWRSKQLPFGFSKAKMLVRIGEHLGDLDGQTFGRLPSGWSTLYLLSWLGATTVKRLVEEKVIHPKLTLREAKELVARLRGKPTVASIRMANVRAWLRRSAEFVRNNKSDWEPDELELATEGLTQLIEEINAVQSALLKGSPSTLITQLGPLADQPINHLNHL